MVWGLFLGASCKRRANSTLCPLVGFYLRWLPREAPSVVGRRRTWRRLPGGRRTAHLDSVRRTSRMAAAGSSFHGVPVVVITGTPQDMASTIEVPKFSKSLGITKRLAARRAIHLFDSSSSPVKTRRSRQLSFEASDSISFRWPTSSGPARISDQFWVAFAGLGPCLNQAGQSLYRVQPPQIQQDFNVICRCDVGGPKILFGSWVFFGWGRNGIGDDRDWVSQAKLANVVVLLF